MVELQILNKILNERSLSIVKNHSLGQEHFPVYQNEFTYIMDHYRKYGNIPDKETFLSRFETFDLIAVHESERYLVETLYEHFLYSKLVPFVNTIVEKVKKDSNEAVSYAKAEIEKISRMNLVYGEGYDIIRNADERGAEYEKRIESDGILGISSGLKELDDITHGWMPEDLVTIVGRTNEGKTWVMLYFLVQAWQAGKRVLLYSGEMSHTAIGFRFDTLYKNFSNESLMHGLPSLGDGVSSSDYTQYLDGLKELEVPFFVVTPKDIGGTRLDVQKLHTLIEKYKPDIVGIDQLSLMADYRSGKGEQERLKYTHIAEDLYLTSERYGIPILTPAQASRESVKDKDNDAPQLHQIAESDGVGQNSTRVISIKQLGTTMKISVKKNRYGRNNLEVLTLWDIDKGVIKPFLKVDGQSGKATINYENSDGEELF